MRNISAVFSKQLKETLKNWAILIQFVMLPAMATLMQNFVKIDDMPENFFVKLFAVMFVGMAPQTCMSSIISEEKEMNTLRVLMMSNVKPLQYLFGTGLYVWLFCMGGAMIFALVGEYSGVEFCRFLAIMALGILLSIIIGAIIGICSKNQMTATSVGIPVMMIFSFVPMLAMFNETIKNFAGIVYSQHLSNIINNIESTNIENDSVAVLGVNLVVAIVIFSIAFRKKGLD